MVSSHGEAIPIRAHAEKRDIHRHERECRCALIHSLDQRVIAVFVFYGFGPGLHRRRSGSALWPIVLGVRMVQRVFSVLGSKRFRQGPMEAHWRKLRAWSARPAVACYSIEEGPPPLLAVPM
jgi:uncharacterized membrane protein YeiB